MKVRNDNRSSRGRRGLKALFAAAASILVLMSACTRDDLNGGYGSSSTGGRRKAKLQFDMVTPSAETKTRSVLDAGGLKVETMWIGVFDTKTGEMLGYKASRPRKADGNRIRIGDGGTWSVDGLDIWYYDSNPEVYIAAVINYEYVMGRRVGDEDLTNLSELLGVTFDEENNPEVTKEITWSDLRAISVDTKSVDAAMRRHNSSPVEELTLAMGFFNTSKGVNTTIDHYGNTPSNARVSLTENGTQFGRDIIQLEGSVNLRRLQSDIKVNIRIGNPDNDTRIANIENLEYKVINKPLEVYLAEHATDKRGGDINADKQVYLSRTANSADWLELTEKGTGYESDKDWIKIDGTFDTENWLANEFTFSYSHYENKHWGLDWPLNGMTFPNMEEVEMPNGPETTWQQFVSAARDRFGGSWKAAADYTAGNAAFAIREHKMYQSEPETALFRTLCYDTRHAFNNYASFIMLRGDITILSDDGQLSRGSACYVIHEGFTSHADGSAAIQLSDYSKTYAVSGLSDITDPICDFQCVRNTQYTYNLTISGMNRIALQAQSEDFGNNYLHNDGYTGQLYSSTPLVHLYSEGNEIYPTGPSLRDGTQTYVYDSDYDGQYDNFAPIIFPSSRPANMDYYEFEMGWLDNLKWRIYEVTPEGTINFGTWDGNDDVNAKLGLPIDGPMYHSAAEVPTDQVEQCTKLYEEIFLRAARGLFRTGPYSAYYYDMYDQTDVDSFLHGNTMSFPTRLGNPMGNIIMKPYEVKVDDVRALSDYERGIVFYDVNRDADGCEVASAFGAYQTPIDPRAEMRFFAPIFYTSMDSDMRSMLWRYEHYTGVMGLPSANFIRWNTGMAAVKDDDNEIKIPWPDSGGSSGSMSENVKFVEPHKYIIQVDDFEPIVINAYDESTQQFSPYRHYFGSDSNGLTHNPQMPNYGGSYSYYYEYPIDVDIYGPGEHTISITPVIDEFKVKLVDPITSRFYILEKPYWDFNGITYPNNFTIYQGRSYRYAGLMGYGSSSGESISIGSNGMVNLGGYGSFYTAPNASRVFSFDVDMHGTVRVDVQNSNASDRKLYCNYRVPFLDRPSSNSGLYYGTEQEITIPANTRQTVDFRTVDFKGDGLEGLSELGVYCGDRLYIHSIEWIPDYDADKLKKTLNTTLSYSQWDTPTNRFHPWDYDWYYSLTVPKHFECHVAFTDNNPIAQQYKFELYAKTYDFENGYTEIISEEPSYTEILNPEDMYQDFGRDGNKLFKFPVFFGNGSSLEHGDYSLAITPVGDPEIYRESKPQHIATLYLVDWEKYPETGEPDGEKHAWEFDMDVFSRDLSTGTNNWRVITFTSDMHMETDGIMLRGDAAPNGTVSNYTQAGSYVYYRLQFRGVGYPAIKNDSNVGTGRNLSFITDIPGQLIVLANAYSSSDPDPEKCILSLYNTNNLNEPVSSAKPRYGFGPYAYSYMRRGTYLPIVLNTGEVNGKTEFILCPGKVNGANSGSVEIYALQFIPEGHEYYDCDWDAMGSVEEGWWYGRK